MPGTDNTRRKIRIYTLGCRANQYESDAMAEKLEKIGVFETDDLSEADLSLINTCAVTGESVRKGGQLIRRIASLRPGLPILVSGCWAQIEPERISSLPGVCAVIGNTGKADIVSVVESLLQDSDSLKEYRPSPIEEAPYDDLTLSRPRRTRSYIKIEDGCDRKCAYCAIRQARGPVRSKDEEDIVREITSLAASGCREFILTGIETSAYGRDTGKSLAGLLKRIDGLPGVERIGLGSLDPTVIRQEMLDTMRSMKHLLPHLHLSVQSGSSSVLRRMRRPYTAEQVTETIQRLVSAVPGIFLTADVITGFPGETEEEFLETVEFCRKARFLHLHIFPFSSRKGTEASRMAHQVPSEIRHSRAARLAAVEAEIKAELLEEYVDLHRAEPVFVLVEERKGERLFGHSEHYAEVYLENGSDACLFRTVPVLLSGTDGKSCLGRICPLGDDFVTGETSHE